jgi:hypothetical protein
MNSIWAGLAIILVLVFVGIAIYFIVFHKHKGYQDSPDPQGQGNTCIYDSDCPINPDGTALRCINSTSPAGSSGAKSGTCTAYCTQDSDCSYGNPTGQTPTCVTNPNSGQQFCTLKTCTAPADCATGELCMSVASGSSQNYCVVLGNNSKTSTYSSQSIPCSQNTCFGLTEINCIKGTGGEAVGSPQWNVQCTYNNDCIGGIPCSTGCYPSATSAPGSDCPAPENKSAGPNGTCGGGGFSSSSAPWPVNNTGYCVQSCGGSTDLPCATGTTCDTSINACTA